ncbi:MAG: glyoxalase [Chloroflexi bacterium RBG_16_54_11]|nr:MAG: glyoxalase [Chloroflexi bacterium RBG_16_54_11]
MDPPGSSGSTHANRSMPPGVIIPELIYDDLETAVAWLCRAFGFVERLRIANHRAQLVLQGESLIAKTDPSQDATASYRVSRADHSIMVHVDDLGHHLERAVECSARVISPPADYPFGERQYTVQDIGGHTWTFSQTIADVDPKEWGGVLRALDSDQSRS